MEYGKKKSAGKYESIASLLQEKGLRPTRQRIALASWLFDGKSKHVTAEQVFVASKKMRQCISLATIYNTLNNFVEAGMLAPLSIDGGQVCFDTNTNDHHHLYDEKTSSLTDIPPSVVRFSKLPPVPAGKEVSRVDVVLRLVDAKGPARK